jgi:hypothetical protein
MKLFFVPKGTQIRAGKTLADAIGNYKGHTTKHNNYFELEEMKVDHTGVHQHASHPDDQTIGGELARSGYSVFVQKGYWAIIHASDIQVM